MVVVPVKDIADFSEEVVLDDKVYVFDFTYNERSDTWHLSVRTREGDMLLTGVRIVLDAELIASYGTRGQPAGELYAVDVTEKIERIGRRELIDNVSLVYVTEAEIEQTI